MVRSYLFGKNRVFYHVDLYRYHQSGSASFGVNEILSDPTGLVAVEWAENFRGRLPKGFLKIRFTYTLSGRRIELLWL